MLWLYYVKAFYTVITCFSDFSFNSTRWRGSAFLLSVVRGFIRNVSHNSQRGTSLVEVSAERVYWQRSGVFEQQAAASGSPLVSWRGHIHTLVQCRVRPGDGEFLFTGSEHFGEAWLGCAPRYKDFLSVYQTAWAARRNSCDFPLDWGSVVCSSSNGGDPCNICHIPGKVACRNRQRGRIHLIAGKRNSHLKEQSKCKQQGLLHWGPGRAGLCLPPITALIPARVRRGWVAALSLCAAPHINRCSLCRLCVTIAPWTEMGRKREAMTVCRSEKARACIWLWSYFLVWFICA